MGAIHHARPLYIETIRILFFFFFSLEGFLCGELKIHIHVATGKSQKRDEITFGQISATDV